MLITSTLEKICRILLEFSRRLRPWPSQEKRYRCLPDNCGQDECEHRYRRLELRGVGGVGEAEAEEEEELVPEDPAGR